MIHYTVGFDRANAHIFNVKLNLNFALQSGQNFYLPNWIPGSYMIRDFAKNIVSLEANSKGSTVKIEKVDKSTWRLAQDVDCLELNYEVYAWDLSVRSAHLDNQHGFFNGTSLFLGIKGYESEPHAVILKASELSRSQHWTVATAMTAKDIDESGWGKYSSESYDELIDHPFEFGKLQKVTFEAAGVPHEMYFTEAPEFVDWERIAKDVKQICETEIAFFGDDKPPFERYVFMTFVQKKGFGGLEHLASTALHCSFDDLPLVGDNPNIIDENYRTFLSLCCHEYFHSWNVKRIKPARFLPMDTSQESHTELLWFFEGITSYYDELLMARSGVISPVEYLDMLAKTITRVYRTTGRFKQTVTESSFDAWTKFYKQDENAINAIVSYYTKGALVAFCLDAEIRQRTNNQSSLDDLMRLVWQRHGKTLKGVGENQIQQLVKELVGESMKEFFDIALYSTQELDLNKVFQQLGIEFQIIPQYLQTEKGGFVPQQKQRAGVSFLDIVHKDNTVGAFVYAVAEDGAGASAGLSNGDVIIAIDDIRVTSGELDKRIARIPIGTKIKITYFRRERLFESHCVLTEGLSNTCYLSLKTPEPTDEFLLWATGKSH